MKTLIQSSILNQDLGDYLWNDFLSRNVNGFTQKVKFFGPQLFVLFKSDALSRHHSNTVEPFENNMPDFDNEALANYYAEGLKLFVKRNDLPPSLDGGM